MENQLWRQFAWGFFIVNTVCAVFLIEFFVFGKPFISIFVLIFAVTLYLNRKLLIKGKGKTLRAEAARTANA